MTLQQLLSFTAIAQIGSIARAAERLALSQPTLSGHIKALESEFALTLFSRTNTGMTLTGDGRRVMKHAQKILAAREELFDEVKTARHSLSGQITIGVASSNPSLKIDALLERIAQTQPRISLHFESAPTAASIENVMKQKIDAGFIVADPPISKAFTFLEGKRFKVRAAAPVAWRENAHDPKKLNALPWILPLEQSVCRHIADRIMSRHILEPDHIVCTANEMVTRDLIASGAGIGFLHDDSAIAAANDDRITLLDGIEDEACLGFAYLAGRDDPVLFAVIDALRTVWRLDRPPRP